MMTTDLDLRAALRDAADTIDRMDEAAIDSHTTKFYTGHDAARAKSAWLRALADAPPVTEPTAAMGPLPRIHDDQLDQWEQVARAATDATWLHGTTEEAGIGARQYMLDCFDRGDVNGHVALVHFPAPDMPDGESMVVAITGNGPTSMANARHIAYSSPNNVILLIAEARAAAALRAELTAANKMVDAAVDALGDEGTPGAGLVEEITRIVKELAAARAHLTAAHAVPSDVDAAIDAVVDGAHKAGAANALKHAYLITVDPMFTVPRLRIAIAKAIAEATSRLPSATR